MNQKIELGDVVRISSESNEMTVILLDKHANDGWQRATCTWFNGNGEQKRGQFHVDSLVLLRKKGERT